LGFLQKVTKAAKNLCGTVEFYRRRQMERKMGVFNATQFKLHFPSGILTEGNSEGLREQAKVRKVWFYPSPIHW
jgi:hypothetical protein